MEQFKQLGIPEYILKVIEADRFEKPSEIQEKAIPLVLGGKDVIAESATGSGKTLAFGTGIIENCEHQGVIQALVLVPTRELANQVTKSLKHFSMNKKLEIVEVYGGVSMGPQVNQLKRADVVVGTPGRILDHIGRETIELGYVNVLVLDEADRMLDMGFVEDVKKIMENCKKFRQTLLFSATISHEIEHLAHKFMNNPVKISAEPQVDPSKLKQYYYDVADDQKFSLLVHLLKEEHPGLIMVFCNTQRNVDNVTKNLLENGIEAIGIHGGLSQEKRNRVMAMFHSNKVCVLVCTDVAARGLDIKGVSHVYNYDIPNESQQYVHRIGRTARAGKEGIAINILASRDYENFANLKKHYDYVIEKKEVPELTRVSFRYKSADGHSRFGGDRRGGRFSGGGRFGGRGGFSRGSTGGRFSRGRSGGSRFSRGRGDRNEDRNSRRSSNSRGGYGFRSSGDSEGRGDRRERRRGYFSR